MEVLMFQSPSLRGSGRFALLLVWPPYADPMVSIPFIAGQWSLRDREDVSGRAPGAFQSPSLRGSGRFIKLAAGWDGSPKVSIPFIAGQWSLRAQARAQAEVEARFNPLHCGAVVASSARSSTR